MNLKKLTYNHVFCFLFLFLAILLILKIRDLFSYNLHLCTFKTPTSWAVLSEQGDADCAFSMCNGVKDGFENNSETTPTTTPTSTPTKRPKNIIIHEFEELLERLKSFLRNSHLFKRNVQTIDTTNVYITNSPTKTTTPLQTKSTITSQTQTQMPTQTPTQTPTKKPIDPNAVSYVKTKGNMSWIKNLNN